MESRRSVLLFLLVQSSGLLFAGEINLSGIFSGFNGTPLIEQRKVEERIEQDLSKFHSIASARVLIPMGEASSAPAAWGNSEPRMIPVDVILKLKKRKRLTLNEFHGIANIVSAGLSEGNRVVELSVRDEDGNEWSDDNPEVQGYFKAAVAENEIMDRLNNQWGKDVNWTQVNVSEKDSACNISGKYSQPSSTIATQVRHDVMGLLQDLCTSARLNVTPLVAQADSSGELSLLTWLERAALLMVGFACYGLMLCVRRLRGQKANVDNVVSDDGAIILTKIVDRNPDEAAKWMVKALLSESEQGSEKGTAKDSGPQIFDQPS